MLSDPAPDAQSLTIPKISAANFRVLEAAKNADLPVEYRHLTHPLSTLAEAAEFLGCPPDSIARTVLFRGKTSRKPVLLILSGEHRIDEKILAGLVGEVLEKADADFVLRATGFAMGGVPPIGIANRITTLVDSRLTMFQSIWCPAGTTDAFFMVSARALARAAAARIVQLS